MPKEIKVSEMYMQDFFLCAKHLYLDCMNFRNLMLTTILLCHLYSLKMNKLIQSPQAGFFFFDLSPDNVPVFAVNNRFIIHRS